MSNVALKNCLILGAGRSGTSLTALLLQKAGYHVCEKTYAPDNSNPFGYFEDLDVIRANEAILAPVYGSRRQRFSRMLTRRPKIISTGAWLLDFNPRRLRNIYLKDLEAAKFTKLFALTPFAYKDPRFSFTLGVLNSVIPKNTVRICVFREPLRVVESTRRHALVSGIHVTAEYCFAVWKAHYRCLLEHYRRFSGQWLFIPYEELLHGSAISRLEETLNVRLDRNLVKPELNRVKGRGVLPRDVAELFDELKQLSSLECILQPALGCESSLGVFRRLG